MNKHSVTPRGSWAEAHLADRVRNARQTALRRFSARCAQVGGINLSQGVCDLAAPDAVKAAAKHAIDADHATYTNLAGIVELRSAIADKMKTFNGIDADPQREVMVTVGAAGAFACAAMATLNPGDEVVMFSPFYNYYTGVLDLLGVKPRFVRTHPPDWAYSGDELAAAFGPRTRMVVINTPSNPTGKVFSRSELNEIAALANKHDAWIIADEVYEYITFGAEHVSVGANSVRSVGAPRRAGNVGGRPSDLSRTDEVGAMPAATGRTITISGGSKTYAITGWRVGYAVGPAAVIDKMLVVNDLWYICAPAPMQYGLLAGFDLDESYYRQMRADYQTKRDMLADTLKVIGFEPYLPQGAFYMMADFGVGRYADAQTAAETILENVGVATVPGAPFFANPADGETQLRFCFAKRMTDLKEACDRLRQL